MAGGLSKSLHSSSQFMKNMEQEAKVTEKQGIITILGSDSHSERNKAASLRRTLSADMSSKKWLAQQGFSSPMKKIASSKYLPIEDTNSSSSDEDEDRFRNTKKSMFHIWNPIEEQVHAKKKNEIGNKGEFDIWSSLVKDAAENEENKKVVSEAPYVHPLVKKQSSSLKGKSLEVCTESLGSETGSEGFASYPNSETGDITTERKEEEQAASEIEQQQQQQQQEKQVSVVPQVEDFQVVKYNAAATSKKSSATAEVRSFPPPIPSLSGSDGASLRIKTHRDQGRVVLEAVSIASTNNFHAERQNGRLVLTFVNPTSISTDQYLENVEVVTEKVQEEEEFEEKSVNFSESENEEEDEDEDEDEEEVDVEREVMGKERGHEIKEVEIVMEEAPRILVSRVTNVHRLAQMMKKPIGLANRTNGWASNKYNQEVKYRANHDDDEYEEATIKTTTPIAQSLPPRPGRAGRLIPKPSAAATATTASAASLNAYEYYWRTKPTSAMNYPLCHATISPPMKSKDMMANQQQRLMALRGNKGDHIVVPVSKSCKEPRSKSLLFWEPYCIITS